jgi:NDP-sugar pyrophosphorylase family protein
MGMSVTGVILAAGFGTRLRPSTEFCPKPLIPVAGVEPLFFALNKLHRLGIKKAIVNAHYLPDKIAAALKEWAPLFPGMEMRISIEDPQILGTGGALLKMLADHPDLFKNSGLLLQNGDTLASFDLQKLDLANRTRSSMAISFNQEHLKKYKPLWVDENLNYSGIGSTPPTPLSKPAHFLGVHYLSPEDLRALQKLKLEVRECDLFNGIYKPLLKEGAQFKGVEFFESPASIDFWFDMTNIEFLLEAQRYVLDSMTRLQTWPLLLKARYPSIREIEPGIWVQSKTRSSAARKYSSPAILVESDHEDSLRELGEISLGPHASLIHSKGQIMTKRERGHLEIRNSVVLLSSEQESPLPDKIQGEVRVV